MIQASLNRGSRLGAKPLYKASLVQRFGPEIFYVFFKKSGEILILKKNVEFLEFFGFTLRFRTLQAKKKFKNMSSPDWWKNFDQSPIHLVFSIVKLFTSWMVFSWWLKVDYTTEKSQFRLNTKNRLFCKPQCTALLLADNVLPKCHLHKNTSVSTPLLQMWQ